MTQAENEKSFAGELTMKEDDSMPEVERDEAIEAAVYIMKRLAGSNDEFLEKIYVAARRHLAFLTRLDDGPRD